MRKRLIAMLLCVATLMSLCTNFAFAADTPEEALGEIDVYNGDFEMGYLSMNGAVKKQKYTYFNLTSADGTVKEVPAYCVNPNQYGVPQTVGPDESIKYIANERSSDPKVVGIVSSGYPHRSLGELKLDNKHQAYYATKMALWCYLIPSWNINNLRVAPGLTGSELDIGQRILAAAKDIYKRGTSYNYMLEPKMTVTPDKATAYPVNIGGTHYKQQVFTAWSETWVCDYDISVSFTDPDSVPAGTRIVDMDNNDITSITTQGTGDGYAGKFKVLYPADAVEGKSGSVQLSFGADVYQYYAMYAICAEKDKYGNLQNYICDMDPTTSMRLSAYSNYADQPTDEEIPEETSLKIVKLEEGTEFPLEGAIFSVFDPEGKKIGSFSTGPDGTVTIPLTLEGHYTVTEEIPPKYHLLPNIRTQHADLEYGKQSVLTFWNAPYGNLRVQKVSDTGDALNGVTIQIKHIESGETRTDKTKIGGVVVFDKLRPGAYEVRELAGIPGWEASTDTIQTITVVPGETSTATFINKELPGLKIVKYDRKSMETMSKVSFEIFRDNQSIGIYQTDAMGEIILTDLPTGTYRVEERHSGDDEHIVDTTPQHIELKAGMGIVELVFFNDKLPGIHLIKVDSADLSKPIANVKFRIEAVDGSWGPEEFTTDENGMIDLSKLPTGAYVVTELEAPGYIIDEAQRIIQLDGNETAQFVFTNSIKPSLELIKLSSDRKPLEGVTFRIAKIEDGTHYLDRTTNAQGQILISDLEPGVYSVRETATTSNHIIDLREYHVELFPGQTSTLVIENQKRPNLIVYKHDADTGEPVPNTVFTVRAADGHSVDEIKTGADGKAVLENLLPGVYEVAEKSVPSPWLLDAPSQLVTLFPNRDHTVYFENHKKPSLTVNKICSVTGEPLKGAKFQVIYASNNTGSGEINDLGTFYTDANGQFQLTGLRDGWYKVTELESVPGYSIKAPATQEVYIQSGTGKVLTFENTPLSALVVWKYDSVTGEAVKNAVFQVKYLTGTSGTGGNVIGTYKTSANGSFTVTGLEEGTYIVEELASDSNHVIDTAPQTAYISGKEQDVVQLYFGNSPKGSLLVKKIDSVTRKPLSDVEFMVTTSDGTVVGDGNGKFTTDSAGSFLVEGIDPGTTLVVKETRAKDGYILDDTPQTAKIKAGQTVILEFRNQPKGGLVVQKIDAITKEPLAGVKFKITTANGELVPDNEGLTSTNGLYVTDENGQIVLSKLQPNTYIVTEVESLPDYALDAPPQTVVVEEGDTQTLTFTNTPKGCLVIKKIDSVTKEPLSGVQFEIKGCNGCEYPAGTYTTDSNGLIKLSHIPSGCFSILETRAKDGYRLDNTAHVVKVENGACKEVTFENEPLGGLVIKKMDAVTKEPLADVIFKITGTDGTVVGASNGEYRTDERGFISIPGLEPGGYVVREVRAKSGYLLDDTPKTIEVKDHQTYTLEFFNHPLGSLIIHKLDSVTKKPLEGVQFKITYADGRVVDDEGGNLSSNGLYWTDKNGQIIIDGITGTLVVTEVESIPGYTIHEETRTQTVVVNPDDTQHLYFYNDPIGGLELVKVNADDKTQRIPNTTFEIRKAGDDALVDTVTTDANGRVFLALEDDHYYAVEVEAAKGFKLDNTPQYFEVKDGKTTLLTVTNKAISGILIHKTNAATGEGIYGVTFLLYDSTRTPIGQYTSDDRGYVYIEDLEAGKYFLRELDNDGYVPDTELKTVYVSSGETTEIEWKNIPITAQIQITKKSADYNSTNGLPAGTLLEGAVFEITDKAGNVVDTIRSDSRGLAASKPLPLGRYSIREVKAPANYGINETVLTAYLEHEGQIVRFEVTNKSLTTGVSISKTGPKEIMAGQPVRYVFSGIANTSNVRLDSFYWRDTIPAQVRLESVVTGTYNFPGTYKITYRVNGGEPRTLADNLSTSKNYTLAASAAALGLASNERVTEIMFVFGQAPAGFAQVEKPYIYCTAVKSLSAGSFVNVADVGGVYGGQWVQAVSRWVTTVYGKTPTLPRTGY